MGTSLTKIYDIQVKLREIAFEDVNINPKVSIIVPTYNNEIYLERCLFSLVEQTLKEIEIIVVNDGSTDNTLSILNLFAEYDKRFKVISQSHSKQGAARNKGMEFATGEYIGFVDSDDWVDLDYFEKLYNTAKKYNSDIALATNVRIGNGKTKKRLNITNEVFVTSLQEKIDISNQVKNPCPTNKIYRKSMLEENNITWQEGCYCEDKLFTIQAVYYANAIVTVPNVNYYYYRNPHSTVNSKSRKLINDKKKARLDVLNFLKEKQADIRDKEFWATTNECKILGINLYEIKSSLKTEKVCLFGIIPVVEICNSTDYKRKRFKCCGIKFTYKTNDWKVKSNEQNIILNKQNLGFDVPCSGKSILYVAANFVKAGGIETRLLQYIKELRSFGWNVYLLSEDNANEQLAVFTNFKLNFDAENFDRCLEEIINRYNIDVVEFQFKNPKILKNLNIGKLKSKVKLGCTIHNLGIKNTDIINKFDYKVMVSKYMYENHYKNINDAIVIQNCIDTNKYKYLPSWEYKGQRKALLVSRINTDKIKSIECFIKYCKKNNIAFEIAGEEQAGSNLKQFLMKKYHLQRSCFIGSVNTLEYLSQHIDDILFIGGVGLVILEAAYLNYPCLCCSDWVGDNYSFVTFANIDLFDNFTIRKQSLVSQKNKKNYELNLERLNIYMLRHCIISNRNLRVSSKKYFSVIEDEDVR